MEHKERVVRKKKAFDPEIPFFELKPVLWTGGIIICLALAMTLWIIFYSNNELRMNLSYEGLNHVFTAFKFPIAILALSIPFGALYAANHRSEQSRHAAELADAQNRFSNYYKHVDEFTKYLENYRHVKNKDIKLTNPRLLHLWLYGKRSDCFFTLRKEIIFMAEGIDNMGRYWKRMFNPKGPSTFTEHLASSGSLWVELLHFYEVFSVEVRSVFADHLELKKTLGNTLYFPWAESVSTKFAEDENYDTLSIIPHLEEAAETYFYVQFLVYATRFDGNSYEIEKAFKDLKDVMGI